MAISDLDSKAIASMILFFQNYYLLLDDKRYLKTENKIVTLWKKKHNSGEPSVFGPFCWTDMVRSIRKKMPELEECAEEGSLLHVNIHGLE